MRKKLSYLCYIYIFVFLFNFLNIPYIARASNIGENQEKSQESEKDRTRTAEEKEEEKQKSLPQGLYAYASCLMDAKNNRVLFEQNGNEPLAMASTTKIMTLIIILENSSMDEIVTASSNAASQPDVQLNIKTGEQYRLEDLLYSLMLESHNDTAVALAEHVGGSVEGFCAMMNEKAAELGLVDTYFETPNGLDAGNHHTTATELAVIASYALKNETFLKITNTTSYQFNELTTGRSFMISNKNRFLYMMDGAVGMKTGFTGKAGYCFVGAVKKGDYELVSVVLACGWPPHKDYKWSDTRKLMDFGLKSFQKQNFLRNAEISINGKSVLKGSENESNPTATSLQDASKYLNQYLSESIPVEGGEKESVTIAVSNVELPELLMAGWEDTKVELNYETMLAAPVEQGQIVGTASFFIDDKEYASTWIRTESEVKKISLLYCFQKVLKAWWNL